MQQNYGHCAVEIYGLCCVNWKKVVDETVNDEPECLEMKGEPEECSCDARAVFAPYRYPRGRVFLKVDVIFNKL